MMTLRELMPIDPTDCHKNPDDYQERLEAAIILKGRSPYLSEAILQYKKQFPDDSRDTIRYFMDRASEELIRLLQEEDGIDLKKESIHFFRSISLDPKVPTTQQMQARQRLHDLLKPVDGDDLDEFITCQEQYLEEERHDKKSDV